MTKIELKLFVTGETPRSKKAIRELESLCEQDFKDEVTLEIIDVLERPDRAQEERIIATPTLIKKLPAPIRRLIGDLSDKEKVLVGLGLLMNGNDGE